MMDWIGIGLFFSIIAMTLVMIVLLVIEIVWGVVV